MSTSTLTSKGQTTIPKDLRKRLNLHPGDRLECVIDENGRAQVSSASIDASELGGDAQAAGSASECGGHEPSHSQARRPVMIGLDITVR